MDRIRNGAFGKKYSATKGAVVVTNVKTGEILSMVSLPDYEPELLTNGISTQKWNEYEANQSLFNIAIAGSSPPGSIFKMVTATAGLETGAITTADEINDTGVYPRGHNPVCWIWTNQRRGHGYLNVSEAIQHSCNYFFYEVGYRVGILEIERYARYYGLGERTGIELPSETSGTLAGETLYSTKGQTWYLGNTLSAAIGQAENEFSPIQISKYVSMLTNGGKNLDLSIVKTIINADGTEVAKEEIEKFSNEKLGLSGEKREDLNINPENLNAILEGMRSVANDTGGTAYSTFKNFGIEVGGKTGSAQAVGKTNAWFVGFAPYNDPEISIVVYVEDGGSGGYTAEVAKEIIGEYFGMNSTEVKEDVTISTYEQTYM
ncbi:MAG: hypothetical protein LBL91_04165 [Lachnospiraceae bacterium]|nr:hypothetical protein [Lachnospiraceae bacterium]